MEIELPEAAGHDRFERVVTVLVGIGAVVAALLVVLELSSHRRESRASAEGARVAVAAFREMTVGSIATGSKTSALARAAELILTTEARQVAGKYQPTLAVLDAVDKQAGDEGAGAYLRSVGFSVPPPPADDWIPTLESQLRTAAAQSEDAFRRRVAESNRAVDLGARYARRSARATLALAVLAAAGALFGLAAILRTSRAGWIALGAGALGLTAAAVVGISALVV